MQFACSPSQKDLPQVQLVPVNHRSGCVRLFVDLEKTGLEENQIYLVFNQLLSLDGVKHSACHICVDFTKVRNWNQTMVLGIFHSELQT